MRLFPVVNETACIACGTCTAVCPAEPNVFEVTEVSVAVHPEACRECEACVEMCPTGSIELMSV